MAGVKLEIQVAYSGLFSLPGVSHICIKAFLALRRRKERNALCLLGKSQSSQGMKKSQWMSRKRNTRGITARGGG